MADLAKLILKEANRKKGNKKLIFVFLFIAIISLLSYFYYVSDIDTKQLLLDIKEFSIDLFSQIKSYFKHLLDKI